MTQDINLQWPAFNIDLNTVDAWARANVGDNYCGLSADHDLTLHFTSDPGDDARAAVAAYWAALDESSSEHANYKPASQRNSEAAASKASKLTSAAAKLEMLGLSADEIAAILS